VHSEEADDREVSEVSVQRLGSVLPSDLTVTRAKGSVSEGDRLDPDQASQTHAISSGEAPFRSAMSCSLILLFWIREYSTFKTE
jgi:hypothetical protein